VVEEFAAVIALLWPSFRRPSVGPVLREQDDGTRHRFIFVSASMDARAKMRATLTVNDEKPGEQLPTQAQQLLAGSRISPNLTAALSLWSDPPGTWPRLYRILEEVERYLGEDASRAGLCTAQQRELFKRSRTPQKSPARMRGMRLAVSVRH
jgi:hypothetical protein